MRLCHQSTFCSGRPFLRAPTVSQVVISCVHLPSCILATCPQKATEQTRRLRAVVLAQKPDVAAWWTSLLSFGNRFGVLVGSTAQKWPAWIRWTGALVSLDLETASARWVAFWCLVLAQPVAILW